MTSRISLFNKGIFNSVLRRYMWGAVLYSILLFMSTSMVVLFSVDADDRWRTMAEADVALIMTEQYLVLPALMAFFVPTVVALLVYRFVHSKKTSIFIHSLPVSRTANYISSVFAALTLMAAPIILNGLILMILSSTAYGAFFDVASCFLWVGINLLTVFMMFSVSSFVAMLTGNSFAMIGLNGLIHCFVIILAAGFSTLASAFLYGYYETNEILQASMKWNFVCYILELVNDLGYNSKNVFELSKLIVMLMISLVFYVVGWLLYKKRRMETAEDVAAFRCLNPIYKYLITFTAALASFGLLSQTMDEKPFLPIAVTVIVSAVVYFAAEMILKKSLKIWKSWKGYAVFVAAFAIVVCIFAFTSFFGYETRVPKAENVESVAIYEYYYQAEEPWLSDEEVVGLALKVHEEMVSRDDIYTVKKYIGEYNSGIHIRYKLKNGETLVRRYPVTPKKAFEVIGELYEFDNYKMKNLELFTAEIGRIYSVVLNHGGVSIQEKEKIEEFVAALQKDALELDYAEMYDSSSWSMNVNIEYVRQQDIDAGIETYGIHSIYQSVNANFKNTVKWIVDNGYLWTTFNSSNQDLCILTAEQWEEYQKPKDDIEMPSGARVQVSKAPTFDDIPEAKRISDQQAKDAIRNFAINTGVSFDPDKEFSYYVCSITDEGYLNVIAAFYEAGEDLVRFANQS